MLNKFTTENISLLANGAANPPIVADFLAAHNQGQLGEGQQLQWVIPRGTRIRLKTFRHIGIKATPQLIGEPNAAGVAAYAPPQVLADGRDFDWGEKRGRFPYQRIVARGMPNNLQIKVHEASSTRML